MRLRLMRFVMAVNWNSIYRQMEAAQAKADIWDIIYRLMIFWAFTYVIFFFCLGITGWFKDFEKGLGVVGIGFVVVVFLLFISGARYLYWETWTPVLNLYS